MDKKKTFWEGVADAFSFSMMLFVAMMLITILLAGCSAMPEAMPTWQRSDVIAELNRYRASQGLKLVTSHPALGDLADQRARNAWGYRNGPLTRGHARFQEDVDASSMPGFWFGENLLLDNYNPTAATMIKAWDESPKHKAMMRRPTTTECNASQVTDGVMAVVALVCVDRQQKGMIQW